VSRAQAKGVGAERRGNKLRLWNTDNRNVILFTSIAIRMFGLELGLSEEVGPRPTRQLRFPPGHLQVKYAL
jgi:hypothetical protein